MYGVITNDLYWDTIKVPGHHLSPFHRGITQYAFKTVPNLWSDWMRGNYNTEDIHQLLELNVGVPSAQLLPIFIEEYRQTRLHTEILQKVAGLRSKMATILITDNMDCFGRWVLPANPILHAAFAQLDNSYDLRSLKSDNNGHYFERTMTELQVKPDECAFIDDSLSNCQTFERLGGYAHHAHTTQDINAFLDTLT